MSVVKSTSRSQPAPMKKETSPLLHSRWEIRFHRVKWKKITSMAHFETLNRNADGSQKSNTYLIQHQEQVLVSQIINPLH